MMAPLMRAAEEIDDADPEEAMGCGVEVMAAELRRYRTFVRGDETTPGRMLTGSEARAVADYVRALRALVQDRAEDLDGDLANLSRDELLDRVSALLKKPGSP